MQTPLTSTGPTPDAGVTGTNISITTAGGYAFIATGTSFGGSTLSLQISTDTGTSWITIPGAQVTQTNAAVGVRLPVCLARVVLTGVLKGNSASVPYDLVALQ